MKFPKESGSRFIFSPMLIKDAFEAVFRKRPGKNRKMLLLMVAIFFMHLLPIFGEKSMAYLYVRTRYQWQVGEYGVYQSVTATTSVLSQLIIVPILTSSGKIPETVILLTILTCFEIRYLIKALAVYSWMYYLGKI